MDSPAQPRGSLQAEGGSLVQDFITYIQNNSSMIWNLTAEHFKLSYLSVLIAAAIGIPFGIIFTRFKFISAIGLNLFSVVYTIPTLALFGIMLPLIGMGTKAALTALIIYSFMPIVDNVYTGIKNVDRTIIEAAVGMGMSRTRILFSIELPMAFSIIVAGLRTAIVNSVGIATLASLIGAGGLGVLVFRGMSSVSPIIIVAGSIPILLLAVLSDYLLKFVENKFNYGKQPLKAA